MSMSNSRSALIHLRSSLAIAVYQISFSFLLYFFSKGKGYFHRMEIDFPLDLRIIKEHNNETGFTPWFPPAAF